MGGDEGKGGGVAWMVWSGTVSDEDEDDTISILLYFLFLCEV